MATSAREAVAYDFVYPGHKLNTQWPVLDMISQHVANELGVMLSTRLQVGIKGNAIQTTLDKYSQCVEQLGQTATVHEISLPPLTGSIWFCMDISVISAVVNSYFGGNAELTPVETPRGLSRTETRVMQHVVEAVLTALDKGWSMLMATTPALVKQLEVERLANAELEQVMVKSEMVLDVGGVELPCQILYPYETLKPLDNQLKKEKSAVARPDEQFSKDMQRELLNCELEIRGVLAESNITLGTLLELKAGDFIALRDVQTVSFMTQNMPLFDASVGNSNGRVSASVSRWHLPVSS